jgi:hypothetical protein
MAKIKSKRWSMKDITVIKKYIGEAKDAGFDEKIGIKNAATHFGVTPNAVKIRYGRYIKGEDMGGLRKNTTKVPMERKKRKYTKNIIDKHPVTHNVYPVAREITFDIRDVKVDLANRKITFIY